MLYLDAIRRAIARQDARRADIDGKRRAAVAMVLGRDDVAPELLLIERATHEGDPWSGHMALPGGRLEPDDDHAREAAQRETLEEVGVDLGHAEFLGRLDDMEGHRSAGVPRLVVSAFVYWLGEDQPLRTNYEVREAFWFPVAELLSSERHVSHLIQMGGVVDFPGILVGQPRRHVVWGLTYRFLEDFFRKVGRPLPEREPRAAGSKPAQVVTGSGG